MGTVSAPLAARLAMVAPGELVDVVLELAAPPAARGSRQEQIEAARGAFEAAAAPVTTTVRRSGGTVLETAWINHTLRVRIPASAVTDVATAEGVVLADLPNRLETG